MNRASPVMISVRMRKIRVKLRELQGLIQVCEFEGVSRLRPFYMSSFVYVKVSNVYIQKRYQHNSNHAILDYIFQHQIASKGGYMSIEISDIERIIAEQNTWRQTKAINLIA